jgi:hypothetical protein
MQHAYLLQPLSQLQALSLHYGKRITAGITALTALTGLTRLELNRTSQLESSAIERLALGSTLSALQHLRDLTINSLPPAPVMEAVSQLAMLTKLKLTQQDPVSVPAPDLSRCLALLPRHIAELHLV